MRLRASHRGVLYHSAFKLSSGFSDLFFDFFKFGTFAQKERYLQPDNIAGFCECCIISPRCRYGRITEDKTISRLFYRDNIGYIPGRKKQFLTMEKERKTDRGKTKKQRTKTENKIFIFVPLTENTKSAIFDSVPEKSEKIKEWFY